MKRGLFILIILCLAFTALSEENIFENLDEESVALMAAQYVGQELPKPLAAIMGNERIQCIVSMNDGGDFLMFVVTKEGKVESVDVNEGTDPTLKVFSSQATIEKIIISDDQAKAMSDALDSEEIRYEAVGFFNSIKFGALSIIAKIMGLFV